MGGHIGKVFKPKYVGHFTVDWINKNKTVVKLVWSDPSVKIHPVQPISRIELLCKVQILREEHKDLIKLPS